MSVTQRVSMDGLVPACRGRDACLSVSWQASRKDLACRPGARSIRSNCRLFLVRISRGAEDFTRLRARIRPMSQAQSETHAERPARTAPVPSAPIRLAFVDNLRWSMIVLVISMHAADTYSPFGNWYYSDKSGTDMATALAFGTYQSFLPAFFMSLLFSVSGYFAAASIRRKGAATFLVDRAARLGLPVPC